MVPSWCQLPSQGDLHLMQTILWTPSRQSTQMAYRCINLPAGNKDAQSASMFTKWQQVVSNILTLFSTFRLFFSISTLFLKCIMKKKLLTFLFHKWPWYSVVYYHTWLYIKLNKAVSKGNKTPPSEIAAYHHATFLLWCDFSSLLSV